MLSVVVVVVVVVLLLAVSSLKSTAARRAKPSRGQDNKWPPPASVLLSQTGGPTSFALRRLASLFSQMSVLLSPRCNDFSPAQQYGTRRPDVVTFDASQQVNSGAIDNNLNCVCRPLSGRLWQLWGCSLRVASCKLRAAPITLCLSFSSFQFTCCCCCSLGILSLYLALLF